MKYWAAAIAASAAVAASGAVAQDQVTDADLAFEEVSEDGATSLGRIVVSAGTDKVAIDTPQAVSVVDAEDIEREQPDTIGDTIDGLPGVKAIGSERALGESFNIRGVGAAASADEPRIIVTIDGAPKFFEQYRLGSVFTDPDLYKSVEVLRGPASSTLYGSGAIGGVIGLQTKDPSDFLTDDADWAFRQKFGVSVGAGGDIGWLSSSYGAWRASDRAEFLFSATARDTPEYENGDGEVVEGSDSRTYSGLAKGVFTLGAERDQTLEISYTLFATSLNDEPYSQTGLGGGVFAAFGTADRDVLDQTAQATYRYTPADAPWIDLAITGSYTSSRNNQTDLEPGPGFPEFAQRLAFGDEWTTDYQIWQLKAENTVATYGEGWENFFIFGAQVAHQDRVSEATLDEAVVMYVETYPGGPQIPVTLADAGALVIDSHPEGRQLVTGFYAQSEFIYDGWLTVIPGARMDFVSLEAGDSVDAEVIRRSHDFVLFSPKLALHAKLLEEVALFGSIARTERAPVLDELYDTDNYDPTDSDTGDSLARGAANEGDPNKEIATNVEGGLAFTFDGALFEEDALKVKFTAFHTEIDDLIYRPGDEYAYANDASATYHGVELEAGYDAGWVFGSAAYSLIRGELDDGTHLDSIPADEVKLMLGGRWRPHNIEFGWSGVFAAAQDRVSDSTSTTPGGGAPTDGYVVHDLFVGWTPEEGALRGTAFRLSAENVTDRAYREHLSGDDAPGFTLRLSAAHTF